ncbi:MAG: DegT/DnrJ/EryC1/StrS family aminotransferase, partial [Candidatus Binatus sp.]
YEIHDMGFKYNLSDVHAAIGLAQLKRADDFMRRRGEIARAYNDAFRADDALQPAYSEPGIEHAWHLYVLRLHPERLKIGRNQFVETLRERGVGCSVHCIPLHTMHYYQRMYGYRDGDFPIAEDIFSRCLSLPIYASMTDDDVAYVIETVRGIVRENRR